MNDKNQDQNGGAMQPESLVGGNTSDQELAKMFMPSSTREAEKVPETVSFADTAVPANLPDDGPAKIWLDVPDGSVLELRVASQNPFAGAIARLSTLAGKVEVWPHQAISPGPKIRPLASIDKKYVLNVIVAFDGDHPGKVAILAKAIHQGAVVKVYFHVIDGARGDIKLSKVLIDMI